MEKFECNKSFRHVIGKSTFKYGFTIPKCIWPFIELPEKGNKRRITLLTSEKEIFYVWLKRLNNTYGHFQVRYENYSGKLFQEWLKRVFSNSYNNPNNINEFLQVIILKHNVFSLVPYPVNNNDSKLILSKVITHNVSQFSLTSDYRFIELIAAIRNIEYNHVKRQMHYNSMFKHELKLHGWENEKNVVDDKKVQLKCDFRKDKLQLEIEFGNARTYYQDIIKFVMSYNIGLINLGGLVVPTKKFAKHLCELGSKRAVEKSNGNKSMYSGMMHFEKASIEFPYIKEIFKIPFFILGIDRC